MFNLRYNILAVFQVLVGLANSVLLIRTFKTSPQTDAFFIAYSIFTTVQLILIMFIEQFMYFYNDVKVNCKEDAHSFYNFSMTLSLIVGIGSFAFLVPNVGLIVKVFASGMDGQRLTMLKDILRILLAGTVVYPLNYLNERLLNAENRFSMPYILSVLPVLFMVFVQVWILFSGDYNISLLAYGYAAGLLLASFAGIWYVANAGIPIRLKLTHPRMGEFVRNSFFMRLGHNMHNLFLPLVTNNMLSAMPPGYASYFYYARKIVEVINSSVIGPSYKIYLSKLSSCWSSNKVEDIKVLIKMFFKGTVVLFVPLSAMIYLMLPFILRLITSQTLTPVDIHNIQNMFLALSGWYLILFLESPFVAVGITSKNSRIFIFTNTLFLGIYFSATFFLKDRLGIYSIPAGAIIGQTVSFAIYLSFALRLLKIDKALFLDEYASRGAVLRFIRKYI